MPSKSKAQHNFFEAVAHSPKFAEEVGVPPECRKGFCSSRQEGYIVQEERAS